MIIFSQTKKQVLFNSSDVEDVKLSKKYFPINKEPLKWTVFSFHSIIDMERCQYIKTIGTFRRN